MAIGLVVFAATAVLPPWRGYNGTLGHFAFITHPGGGARLDIHRLLVEWIVIVAVTGALLLLTTRGKSE